MKGDNFFIFCLQDFLVQNFPNLMISAQGADICEKCFMLIDAMGAITRKQTKILQLADESNDFGEETLHQLTTLDKKII